MQIDNESSYLIFGFGNPTALHFTLAVDSYSRLRFSGVSRNFMGTHFTGSFNSRIKKGAIYVLLV